MSIFEPLSNSLGDFTGEAASKLRGAAFAAIAISVSLVIAFVPVLVAPARASYPPEILYAVPITISNLQSNKTSAPFDQMLTVNSSVYGAYEASNLQNVEFFYANGIIIPSWLESGNSNTATNTIYWLKLTNGIPADSMITIFMGFADPSVVLFNGKTVGEAPELSLTYAQYDNGQAMFPFYDNFYGTTLSNSWVVDMCSTCSYQVNNGLTLSFQTNGPGGISTSAAYSQGSVFDTFSSGFFTGTIQNVGFFTGSPSEGAPFYGAHIQGACGNVYPDQSNTNGQANPCGLNDGYFLRSPSVVGVYTVSLLASGSSFQYLNYSTAGTSQPITANPPTYPLHAGYSGVNAYTTNPYLWARVRASPPNAVMPSATFGVIWCPGQGGAGVVCPVSQNTP